MHAPASAFSLDSVVVGRSPRMRAIFDYLAVIGPGQGTVLVTGESGTGKEVIANTIHLHSPRRDKPFVAVSCAIFSDSLIEAELFGHERGAFTGALNARLGRFERAEGGTLFLDDIDDVPLSMQVKLLRALQNRTIERLGGTRAVPVDVRVIAGTKRNLREMVHERTFREDLFYRLHVLTVDLPPLRDRREDLLLLADHFMRRFFARRGLPVLPMSEGVKAALFAYDWPGNVRELENTCERLAESCACGHVRLGCLAASVLMPRVPEADADRIDVPGPIAPVAAGPDETQPAATRPASVPAAESLELLDGKSLDDHLREIEAQFIETALTMAKGNKSRAAELLRVKRSTLGDRIERLALS